jgi:hypothetical protein
MFHSSHDDEVGRFITRDLFGCSNALVANKSKDTGRCCFLLQRWSATTFHFPCT